MAKRIVIALGGNALGHTPSEQIRIVKNTAKTIVDLIEDGNEVVIGHGNGPQVGMINLAMEYSSNSPMSTPYMPFAECGAMSQGYIGYQLQQAIENELKRRKINKDCCTIVTQVLVDKDDPAFKHPTKPVGAFYSKEEAKKFENDKGFIFTEDAGRGYRRVVASPKPQKIIELNSIKTLIASGKIVISCGGGGIPVVESKQGLRGVAAVIDKDWSCAKLALDLEADSLLILTAVDKVSINFNTKDQVDLDSLNLEEIDKYIAEGEFAKGSMLPKIEACKNFIMNGKENCHAIITSLEKADQALKGRTGTILEK